MGKHRKPPRFRDRFLKNSLRAFQKRTKAISHHGSLEFHWDANDNFEWLTVTFSAPRLPAIVLQLVERNRVNLYIRSNDGKDRGKILFRMEGTALVDDASGIVNAFELTMASLDAFKRTPGEARTQILQRWYDLAIRPVA